MNLSTENLPLISVIIPCYNHGKFLPKAVKSVLQQDISAVEIIVVDDGSSDDTAKIAKELDVIYVSQKNQGLSSARNTGIKHSNGNLLVFLDADDWLLPCALKTNADILIDNPNLAFISGAYEKVFEKKGVIHEVFIDVEKDHYERMLEGNYIGMHATVMYHTWIFDEFLYDTSLKMCEDYDLFLKISRKYPVAHHTKKIAAYRFHDNNMSNETSKMLKAALKVLKRQKPNLASGDEKKAYRKGKEVWKNYYTKELYNKIREGKISISLQHLFLLLKYSPRKIISLIR